MPDILFVYGISVLIGGSVFGVIIKLNMDRIQRKSKLLSKKQKRMLEESK